MCVAAVPLIITAISTAVSMYAQHQQTKAQESSAKAAAQYNADAAAQEAETQRQLAQNEIAKGAAERNRVIRSGLRHMGEMRSGLAASGFEMDSGSALSVLGESAEEIQYDADITTQNAHMAAWQHQVGIAGAENAGAWANYQKDQAKNSGAASALAMGGTLLGGIAQGMGQYNDWQKTATPVGGLWSNLNRAGNSARSSMTFGR